MRYIFCIHKISSEIIEFATGYLMVSRQTLKKMMKNKNKKRHLEISE